MGNPSAVLTQLLVPLAQEQMTLFRLSTVLTSRGRMLSKKSGRPRLHVPVEDCSGSELTEVGGVL